jgi:N-acetylated-alpha-linked acidic dipeptidase
VGGFVDKLTTQPGVREQLNLASVREAQREWSEAGAALEQALQRVLAQPASPTRTARLGAMNDAMRAVEQTLLNDGGIPGRPWFRHVLYAPRYTYAAMTLPGVQEAIDAGDWARARAQLDLVTRKLHAATAATRQAAEGAMAK